VDAVLDNLSAFGQGLRTTLALTLVTAVLSLAMGMVLAAFRVSPVPVLRGVGTTYVEVVRNTPLTVVFFFSVFVLPQVALVFSFFTFAVIALTVYHAAFFCEAVRSGINSVGVGQAEAARAIGLTFTQSLRLIVLPQAMRTVIPPLINVFIALTKNTSVAAAFGVTELTQIAQRLGGVYAGIDVIAVFLAASIGYLVITIPSGIIAGRVERRVAFAR
jgi:glutamate transport system permease protein